MSLGRAISGAGVCRLRAAEAHRYVYDGLALEVAADGIRVQPAPRSSTRNPFLSGDPAVPAHGGGVPLAPGHVRKSPGHLVAAVGRVPTDQLHLTSPAGGRFP